MHLVTGGAGFLGSHLVEQLRQRGHAVRVLDVRTGGDVRDREAVAEALIGVRCVHHLAALGGVRASVREPATFFDVNVGGTRVLAEEMARAATPRLVFTSSSSVYGDSDRPSREGDPLFPCSPYAETKVVAEGVAADWHRRTGGELVVVRPFSLYGPRGRADMAVRRFLEAALTGDSVTLYGDGSASRDFTWVTEVAALLVQAGTAPIGAPVTVNAGRGAPVSVRKLIEAVEGVVGRPLNIVEAPAANGDVSHTHADTRWASDRLGWNASVDLEDGLASTLKWLQERVRGLDAPMTRS